MAITLPRMDVPVNVVEWELFVPGEYRFVKPLVVDEETVVTFRYQKR